MIVLSSSMVLSAANPLTTPIFLWDNLVTVSNVSANSEDIDHPVANLANPATNLRWQAEGGSPADDRYITVLIDTIEQIDALAVAVHNFGSAQIPVSVEIASQQIGSPLAYDWQEVVQDTIHANDDPIIFRFTPQTVIAIRLRMQPGLETPRVAVLYVGKLLVAERGTHTDHVPIQFGYKSRVTDGKSESGHFLGRIVLSSLVETSFSLQRITDSWYRTYMDEFIQASKETPFFFAWRPQTFPTDVGYCTIKNDPRPTVHFDTGTVAIELQLNGVSVNQ